MLFSRRHVLSLGTAFAATTFPAAWLRAEASPLRVTFALNRGPYDASNCPFLLAKKKGYFRDENIDVEFSLSKDAEDALHRVASNDFDFGFLDLSVLLRFAAEKPAQSPLYIFTVFDRSPASVVTWRTAGVSKPRGLIGKTLAAVATDGAYALFPAFLRAANIDPASVKLKITTLAERENAMLRREADGAIGFDSTILFKLQKAGASLKDVDFTYYSSGGLDLYSNGIIVSRQMLSRHPDRIAGVVRASAKGWRDALASPQEAMDALAEVAPDFDRRRESERLEWIKSRQIATPEVLRDGMGLVNAARLQRILQQVLVHEGGRSQLRADQIYSSAYMPAKIDRTLS